MDERLIRARLDEARRELDSLQERHDALVGLVHSYETLLRLETGGIRNGQAPQPALPMPVKRSSAPKGTISLSKAVQNVLRDAEGSPLRSEEILKRALALGAVTEAKNPQGAIELVCGHLVRAGKAFKSGPRTFQWREPLAASA